MNNQEIVNTFFTFTHEEIPATDVNYWEDLGFNAASTFVYDPREHSLENFLEMLDNCLQKGIGVLVTDSRIKLEKLVEGLESEFRECISTIFKEYGNHPAIIGFFLVDEPVKELRDATVQANLILLEYNEKLLNFVNFLPYDDCEGFTKLQGCTPAEYEDILIDIIIRGKFKLFGTDQYGPLIVWGPDRQMQQYFINLNMCRRISEKTGAACWFGAVCFGHMNIRTPKYADLLWQQSAIFMHGLRGVDWYKLYDKNKKGLSAFNNGVDPNLPINAFHEKGRVYDDLRMVTKLFNAKFKSRFNTLRHIKTWHHLKGYGDTPMYFAFADEKLIRFKSDHDGAAILARFEDVETQKTVYGIMNMSQELPELFMYTFNEPNNNKSGMSWIQPGEMILIELDN